jgi:hypothetical protein
MTVETDAPSSILAVTMRVAALSASGTTPAGASGLYVTDSLVRFSWQPDVEAGLDMSQRRGDGSLCTAARTPDVVKRYTCTLDICAPDPELEQLLSGGVVLTSTGSTVGYGAPKLRQTATPNGVSVEIWSEAQDGDSPAATNPFFWWAFPMLKLEKKGQRTLEAGVMANSFEGYMYENASWGNGPNNDWLLNSDRAYQYQRTATHPSAAVGLQAIPAQV